MTLFSKIYDFILADLRLNSRSFATVFLQIYTFILLWMGYTLFGTEES